MWSIQQLILQFQITSYIRNLFLEEKVDQALNFSFFFPQEEEAVTLLPPLLPRGTEEVTNTFPL